MHDPLLWDDARIFPATPAAAALSGAAQCPSRRGGHRLPAPDRLEAPSACPRSAATQRATPDRRRGRPCLSEPSAGTWGLAFARAGQLQGQVAGTVRLCHRRENLAIPLYHPLPADRSCPAPELRGGAGHRGADGETCTGAMPSHGAWSSPMPATSHPGAWAPWALASHGTSAYLGCPQPRVDAASLIRMTSSAGTNPEPPARRQMDDPHAARPPRRWRPAPLAARTAAIKPASGSRCPHSSPPDGSRSAPRSSRWISPSGWCPQRSRPLPAGESRMQITPSPPVRARPHRPAPFSGDPR